MSSLPATFEEFVMARGPAMLRFAWMLTSDRALAEELVQEALAKAYRRWGRLRPEHPEAYVRRIVLNEYLGWRRRRCNGELPLAEADGVQPDLVDQLADRDVVWRALAALPRRQRAVLVLRYYEGLPDTEIAGLLRSADGTVRSLASRAFDALRRDPHLVASIGGQVADSEEDGR